MIKISDAELKVMQIIWNKRETTSGEIISELTGNNWNHNTIRTLITRLMNKKAVGIKEKNGKVYTFVPLIDEKKYKCEATKKLIKLLFNGSYEEFFMTLIEIDKEGVKKAIEQLKQK